MFNASTAMCARGRSLYVSSAGMLVVLTCLGTIGAWAQKDNMFRVHLGNLYEHLLNIAHSGLQANKIQEDLKTNFIWEYKQIDGSKLLQKRLEAFSEIMNGCIKAVWLLRQEILDNFDVFVKQAPAIVPRKRNCCYAKEPHPDGCTTTPHSNETATTMLSPKQVLETMKANLEGNPYLLVQYFTFSDGSLTMYPSKPIETCTSYNPTKRFWYIESESSFSRDVVLLVDETSSAAHPNLLLPLLNQVIDSMTISDRIVVIPSNDIADGGRIRGNWWAGSMRAGLGLWMDGQQRIKDSLRDLVEKEVASAANHRFDSHVDALHWAEYLLYEKPIDTLNLKRDSVDVVVLVTGRRGWREWRGNAELADAVDSLQSGNATLIVFTLPGADDDYSESSPRLFTEPSLHVIPVSNEKQLDKARLSNYFLSPSEDEDDVNSFRNPNPNGVVITLPYNDAFGSSVIVSVCLPIKVNSTFWGTSCCDVSVFNLFEKIMRIPEIEGAYAFVMNKHGRAMMHPLLPPPLLKTNQSQFVQMTDLEQHDEIHPILQAMLEGRSGSKVVLGRLIHSQGRPFQIALPNAVAGVEKKLQYLYGPVTGSQLSMAIVLPMHDLQTVSVGYSCSSEDLCQSPHFQYHRWDLDSHKPDTCRFFGMEAAHENALVKLAPSCYVDVLRYLHHESNESVAQLYDIFRHGHTLTSHLVGSELREDVSLGGRAAEYWKAARNVSQFIGARYLGTKGGVFVMYPGTQMNDQTYDPRVRPWYQRAKDSVSEDPVLTLSPPYCDSFGAGLIVTMSMALTNPDPLPRCTMAVVSGDFTSQYMNDNFVQQLPECETEFSCFMMDNSGYVVAHTKWQNEVVLLPTACKVPTHGAHINQVEPFIASKLVELNILRRRGCFDYARSDLFLYWSVNQKRNQRQVVTDDFAINHIPFTNLYLIVYKPFLHMDKGCHCPKSWEAMQPPRCRNTCSKFCECPCVAGINTSRCQDNNRDLLREKLPACWPLSSVRESHPSHFAERLRTLKPCRSYKCTAEDRRSCSKRSMGCFWYEGDCRDVNTL